MKSQKFNTSLRLLPNCFKKVGIFIMLLAFAFLLLIAALDLDWASSKVFKIITMNTFILALLFIAWAKDKSEDEMTMAIRLKAMGSSFILAVLYVIMKPLIDGLFADPFRDLSAMEVVFFMLTMYLITYSSEKRSS
jgi:hypothetical protein